MAYVRTRLGRLFYEERGAERRAGDPAIVLLHGLLFDGGMWRAQIEPLSALGRVVVFDGPGHGRSEPGPRFTLEDHADALFDAFVELGIQRAVVVGLSWGGMVALRLGLQYPAKVAGLAILDASAESDSLPKRLKYRAFIAMHRRVGFPYSLFERELGPLMFSGRTRANDRPLLEASYRRTMGFEREGLARAALAVVVHRKDILADTARIRTPTLVLCGREDGSTPPERSEAMARTIPGAKLVILDGVGHMSALEAPAEVNAHVVPFVRRCVEGEGQSTARAG
ncbi:MAG: Beta-ketoadipate enol-lactone hydrolase [Labilithrix sp.]|nr:Beta-ketoadipate enol-lactone hydrolase [Labilithrix sp.]